MATISRFFALPRELRDRIYTLALRSETDLRVNIRTANLGIPHYTYVIDGLPFAGTACVSKLFSKEYIEASAGALHITLHAAARDGSHLKKPSQVPREWKSRMLWLRAEMRSADLVMHVEDGLHGECFNAALDDLRFLLAHVEDTFPKLRSLRTTLMLSTVGCLLNNIDGTNSGAAEDEGPHATLVAKTQHFQSVELPLGRIMSRHVELLADCWQERLEPDSRVDNFCLTHNWILYELTIAGSKQPENHVWRGVNLEVLRAGSWSEGFAAQCLHPRDESPRMLTEGDDDATL